MKFLFFFFSSEKSKRAARNLTTKKCEPGLAPTLCTRESMPNSKSKERHPIPKEETRSLTVRAQFAAVPSCAEALRRAREGDSEEVCTSAVRATEGAQGPPGRLVLKRGRFSADLEVLQLRGAVLVVKGILGKDEFWAAVVRRLVGLALRVLLMLLCPAGFFGEIWVFSCSWC